DDKILTRPRLAKHVLRLAEAEVVGSVQANVVAWRVDGLLGKQQRLEHRALAGTICAGHKRQLAEDQGLVRETFEIINPERPDHRMCSARMSRAISKRSLTRA